MPKPKMGGTGGTGGGHSWKDDPATTAQITKLYVLLREMEVVDMERGRDFDDYEDEAVDWCNQYLDNEIKRMSDLKKGQMDMLFGHLE